jgi:hypothetical protein
VLAEAHWRELGRGSRIFVFLSRLRFGTEQEGHVCLNTLTPRIDAILFLDFVDLMVGRWISVNSGKLMRLSGWHGRVRPNTIATGASTVINSSKLYRRPAARRSTLAAVRED